MPKVRGRKNKSRMSVKVSRITAEGFWLHTYKKDYYVSRKLFPWFRNATVSQIQKVKMEWIDDPEFPCEHGDMIYWPLLNIDLGTADIERKTNE